MSLLAQFFVLGRDNLPDLVEAATPKRKLFGKGRTTFPETFQTTARELDTFDWSGYHFAVLLPYLEQLRPDVHSEDELCRFFEEFNEYEDPDAGQAMQAALAGLHRHIGDLDDSSVLLMTVG